MRKTKTVDVPAVPATTEEVSDGVVCDKCHQHYPNAELDYDGSVRWTSGFDVCRTSVVFETNGAVYPEGGGYTQLSLHVCPTCMGAVWGETPPNEQEIHV